MNTGFNYKKFISECFIMDTPNDYDKERKKMEYHAKRNGTYIRKRKPRKTDD